MERDLQQTPLYREIEEHFRRALEPGFGLVTALADLDVSPDGAWIAFTGTRLEALEGAPSGRVSLVETAGGESQQLTAGPNDDRLPRWSPDGSRIAFLSDRVRQGRFQAYLLESGRLGEAVALPKIDGTIESLVWSPSGERLLFVAAGVGADQAGASGSGATKTAEDLPSWVPLVEGIDENKWRQLWVLELRTREARRVADRTNVWEATWAGEDSIAAIASDAPGEDAWYHATLRLIDAGTGAQRELVTSDVQLGVPVASPDGTRVAVIEALCSDRILLAGRLLLVDTADGSTMPVDTEAIDVTDVAWCKDDSLLVAGLRGMDTVVARIDTAGSLHERWSTSQGCGVWLPQARPVGDDAFALVLDSQEHPPELTIVRGGKPETLFTLDHNGTRYLAGSLGRLERLTWTAPDGLEIEGLLTVPDGPGPHALVVVVHGGPVWAYTNRWPQWPRQYIHPLMARGYAVLQPNPRGSAGRGRAFAEMVVGDMGGADAQDVLSGIDALVERGIVDPARIGVTGGSYGGFMSCWLPTIDQCFAAAVAVSPVSDWYSQHFDSNIGMWDRWFLGGEPTDDGGPYRDRSPVMRADRVRTPTLLTAGLNDRCTPPGQAMEFYRALCANGVDSEVVLYPEEGHGVRKFPAAIDLSTRMVAWFERFMPPNPREGSS